MGKKKEFKLIQEGDIVVLTDGRVFRSRNSNLSGDYLIVTWIDDKDDNHIFDFDRLDIESVIRPTPENIFTFNVAHSLHQRLNRFKDL